MVDQFMQAAIEEAEQGLREGGIPIGSVGLCRGGALGSRQVPATKQLQRCAGRRQDRTLNRIQWLSVDTA